MAIKNHIVRKKLLKLCKEQLANKSKFNLISFNSKVDVWRDSMVKCSFDNLENALRWVDNLQAQGSTNTFGALSVAYEMDDVEAIYLLSDGLPDQPPDLILSQVKETLPIHTISFNCTDPEANQFLFELSQKTNGRYHCFSEISNNESMPPTHESEDLTLIRREIENGLKDLDQMLKLRNECLSKDLSFKEEKRESLGKRPLSSQPRPYSAIAYNETRSSLLRNSIVPKKELQQQQQQQDQKRFTDEKPTKKKRKKKKRLKKNHTIIQKWLQTNSISAMKLTILDALKPTIIQQKPTYVESLDKEVFSKVYGDIFPIIHSASGKTREFQIVNPQAVDLVAYETKLQLTLNKIEEKLNDFVLENISPEFKESHCPNNEEISYRDMKEEIQKDLNEQELTTSISDLDLLEEELEQGRIYMKQSQDLRETVKQLSNEAKEEKEKQNQQNESPKKSTKTITSNPRFRYHRVLARSDVDGFYYPAIVNKYVNARFVSVLFDDGEVQVTCVRYLIPIGGSAPCPVLNVGDYVLVKCTSIDAEIEKVFYVPGIIQVSPLKMKATDNFYTVIKFNTKKCTVLRKDIVKITRSRFIFSFKFIQESEQNITSFDNSKFDTLQSLSHVPRPPSRDSNSSSRSSIRTVTSRSSRASSRVSVVSNIEQKKNENESDEDDNESGNESETKAEDLEDDKEEEENEEEPHEERDHISKEIEELKSERQKLLDTINTRLREEDSEKSRVIEEQKVLLTQFQDKLTLNETRLTDHQSELDRLRAELIKEKEDSIMEKKLKDSEEVKDKYKDLASMQMDLFQRLQEQQERFFDRMMEQSQSHPQIIKTENPEINPVKNENEDSHQKVGGDVEIETEEQKEEQEEEKPTLEDDNDEENDEKSENIENENENNDEKNEETSEDDDDDKELKVLFSPKSDAVLLTQGDTGVYVSRSPLLSDPAVESKRLPSVVQVNEEVLSRFMDDGWYYRGIVKKTLPSKDMYLVEDGVGEVEEVERGDIITDDDDAPNVIRPTDYVIALHPSYLYAYAPGFVVNDEPDVSYRVQFYDGQIAVVPRAEAYLTSREKFQNNVRYIRAKEQALIGQAVVCRSNKTGAFYLGAVRDRVSGCRNYLVEWADRSLDIQNYAYIFGSHTKRHKFSAGSKVLAVFNPDMYEYLPGTVTKCNGQLLQVKFINNKKMENVDASQAFWLSSDYFQTSAAFWMERNKKPESSL